MLRSLLLFFLALASAGGSPAKGACTDHLVPQRTADRFRFEVRGQRLVVRDNRYLDRPVIEVMFQNKEWTYAGLINEKSYAVSELARREYEKRNRAQVQAFMEKAQVIYHDRAQVARWGLRRGYFITADWKWIIFQAVKGYAVFSLPDSVFHEFLNVDFSDGFWAMQIAGEELLRELMNHYLCHFYEMKMNG